jgi:hypothetical protein
MEAGRLCDWLHHRQILEQQRELAADAKDLSDTANGLPDSLFGLLTLNYTHLMNRDSQTPEEFEKKRKELSLVSQDISRMHRCHINTRRVEVQELASHFIGFHPKTRCSQ